MVDVLEQTLTGNSNRDKVPDPQTCGCGALHEWTWYAPCNGRFPPRWAAPTMNPCSFCRTPGPIPDPLDALEELDNIELRLARAGLPKPMRYASLDRGRVALQGTESDAAFRARMGRSNGMLGVLKVNADAFAVVTSWAAEGGLLMLGPSGTGKSTLLAALARKWLAVEKKGWTSLPDQPKSMPNQLAWDYAVGRRLLEARSRRSYMAVAYTQVGDLLRREKLKQRELDGKPLIDYAMRRGIVMLDELGAGRAPTAWEADRIEQILVHRHDYRLPTVVATNRTLEELTGSTPVFGERIARRLLEWPRAHFGGDAWHATT